MLHSPPLLVRFAMQIIRGPVLRASSARWCSNCGHEHTAPKLDPLLGWDTVVKCSQCGAYDTLLPRMLGLGESQYHTARRAGVIHKPSASATGSLEWALPSGKVLGSSLFIAGSAILYLACYGTFAPDVVVWLKPLTLGLASLGIVLGIRSLSSQFTLRLSQSSLELERMWLGLREKRSLQRASIKEIRQDLAYLRNNAPVYCILVQGTAGSLKFGSRLAPGPRLDLMAQLQAALQLPAHEPKYDHESRKRGEVFQRDRLSITLAEGKCCIDVRPKSSWKALPLLILILGVPGYFLIKRVDWRGDWDWFTLLFEGSPLIALAFVLLVAVEVVRQELASHTLRLDAFGLHFEEQLGRSRKERQAKLAEIMHIKIEEFPATQYENDQLPTRRLAIVLQDRALSLGLDCSEQDLLQSQLALNDTLNTLKNSA